jgi:hypothetical protein
VGMTVGLMIGVAGESSSTFCDSCDKWAEDIYTSGPKTSTNRLT